MNYKIGKIQEIIREHEETLCRAGEPGLVAVMQGEKSSGSYSGRDSLFCAECPESMIWLTLGHVMAKQEKGYRDAEGSVLYVSFDDFIRTVEIARCLNSSLQGNGRDITFISFCDARNRENGGGEKVMDALYAYIENSWLTKIQNRSKKTCPVVIIEALGLIGIYEKHMIQKHAEKLQQFGMKNGICFVLIAGSFIFSSNNRKGRTDGVFSDISENVYTAVMIKCENGQNTYRMVLSQNGHCIAEIPYIKKGDFWVRETYEAVFG